MHMYDWYTPFCHDGVGLIFTGFPPILFKELFLATDGEFVFLTGADTFLRGALATTAAMWETLKILIIIIMS